MKTFNQDKKLTKEEIDVINRQKVFGKTLDELENYSIKDLYNFIKDHSTYLDNIPSEEASRETGLTLFINKKVTFVAFYFLLFIFSICI